MTKAMILAVMLAFAASAFAQMYRWVDKDGRVHYTATPPPAGVKARTLRAPVTPPPAADDAARDDAAKDAGAKDARKGPLTPAEQEQEFRKRQLEAQKAREKQEMAAKEAETKRENCARAREALATFDSGQRISRTNAQGERYYLDDDARARETEAARRAVQDWCG
ncbi:MAG TPA: DUF4124 domain-containing protein [Burkholderiales bacterium]|nr:DUF4124 domain-containing protein [Burkholderiales bacterium]